jgi:acyl carrier protein
MMINENSFAPGISESGIMSRVRGFVQDNSLYQDRGFVLSEDDRFFEKAALDSKYVAAMVTFIEDEFGVLVSNCEVTEENLGSLRAVARFVAGKQPFAVG